VGWGRKKAARNGDELFLSSDLSSVNIQILPVPKGMMNHPASSSGVSSSLLGRHSVLDTACPVHDTGESSRVFCIPAFAGMTNSQQATGNTTQRKFKGLEKNRFRMYKILLFPFLFCASANHMIFP
jgi:hypothetical protein